jgi:hypothetical protein
VISTLLILLTTYSIVILGLVLLLCKLGVSERSTIILGFLIFGAVTGLLTAWVWPTDSSIYFNLLASFLGDQIYNLSIRYFGDASSPQAHYTIPWILRIPQVYAMASTIACGLVGLPLQWAYNRGLKVDKEDT